MRASRTLEYRAIPEDHIVRITERYVIVDDTVHGEAIDKIIQILE